MTPAQFASYVRLKTRTNSTTFTDADIITLMRQRQDDLAYAILKADEDILLIPETLDLVLNQREYALDTDIISRIKRVEAKLDGSNWLKLFEIDITQLSIPIASEADIVSYFTNTQYGPSNTQGACFDMGRKAIYILSGSITAVTAGLKFWVDTYPTAITDLTGTSEMNIDPSTTTHGIPRPLHKLWADGVVIDYKSSREKPIPLTEREQNWEMDLQRAIEVLKHGNMDREVFGYLPPASDRGDEGFDY